MTQPSTEAPRPEAVEHKDPVCGMAVPAHSRYRHVHDGLTYLFCSANCLAKFRASPAAFTGKQETPPPAAHSDAIYTCPMHPEIRQSSPGTCPKCGMVLEEASAAAATTGIAGPLQYGVGASAVMLAIYFGVVGLISGMDFALEQFAKYWYFIVLLALGFGIQVGLFTHLKRLVGRHGASGKVVAVSGTTSTAAMVSCCAHYLVNVLPVLGVTGFLVVVAEYQIELFWVGLAFNAAGITYILSKVVNASKEHKKC
ncbi:MAG: YHS domain-containing protein [Sideroxyarcus sp.]|nr:YHS domain-containing protein [Sideroxyarcus sp.]